MARYRRGYWDRFPDRLPPGVSLRTLPALDHNGRTDDPLGYPRGCATHVSGRTRGIVGRSDLRGDHSMGVVSRYHENSVEMRITEIFFSIQGESTHAGEPCIFVRLTGCSLRCVYCDTKYSYSGGREIPLGEVLSIVQGYPSKLVEVTGGE